MTARTIEDVLLGEAVSGSRSKRLSDMIAIASTIKNRMDSGRATVEEIIAAPGQFSAYGRALPKGVEAYRDLAREAWAYVGRNGPTHRGMYYATPAAIKNLPSGLKQISKTAGHVFFEDQQGRAFQTTKGYVRPSVPTMAGAEQPDTDIAMRLASFPPVAKPAAPPRSAGMLALTPSLIPKADVSALSAPGKGRSALPTSGIVDMTQAATHGVIPGATAHLYSGMEPAGRAPVGTPYRHPLGFAGDFDFYTPDKKRITDPVALQDIAMSMAAKNNANVGYGETGYMGKGRMHLDVMPLDRFPGGATWGRTAGGPWKSNLDFARATGIGPTPYSNAPVPSSRELAVADMNENARQNARLGRPTEKRQDAFALLGFAKAPASASGAPQAVVRASAGLDGVHTASTASAAASAARSVSRAPLVPDRQFPAGPERISPPVSLPSDRRMPSGPVRTAPAVMSLAPDRPMPGGPLPAPVPTLPAALTNRTPMQPQQTFQPGAPPMPSFMPQALGSVVPPPQARIAPNRVPAPPLAPPRALRDYPVAQHVDRFPPAPPPSTVRDVYAGRAPMARDAFGNTVTSTPGGSIGITNKYGATTYSRDGLTTAAGADFGGTPGFADRLKAPTHPNAERSRAGDFARSFGGGVAGSAVGSLLGPVGSALGALIGAELAKPGGGRIGDFARGVRTIDTSNVPGFGPTTQFARPNYGLNQYPDAPRGGSGNGPSFSNLSRSEMDRISPKASRDVSRGKGGLF